MYGIMASYIVRLVVVDEYLQIAASQAARRMLAYTLPDRYTPINVGRCVLDKPRAVIQIPHPHNIQDGDCACRHRLGCRPDQRRSFGWDIVMTDCDAATKH